MSLLPNYQGLDTREKIEEHTLLSQDLTRLGRGEYTYY